MARTDRPTANATATRPADGAENSAAPQTAVTSVNVPMNSAPNSRDMVSPLIQARLPSRARITWFTRSRRGATGLQACLCVSTRAGIGGKALQRVRVRHRDDVVAAIHA